MSYALGDILKPIAYCEIDPVCQAILHSAILAKRLDRAPIHNDIRELKGKDFKQQPVIITAGFPCQDISVANPRGLGVHGNRSGLIQHVFRLIDECPLVQAIFLENSPCIAKRGLDMVLESLSCRNFQVRYMMLSAADVGAPHTRNRWWCFAQRPGFQSTQSLRNLKVNWNKERGPRVVVRRPNTYRLNTAFNNAYGNAVVPLCAQTAFNALLTMSTIQAQQKKRLSLILSDGFTTFYRTAWPTPNASRWYQYNVLTLRSTQMLSNAIFLEDKTKSYFTNKVHPSKMDKSWMINPNFVGWLMGYPEHWHCIRIRT